MKSQSRGGGWGGGGTAVGCRVDNSSHSSRSWSQAPRSSWKRAGRPITGERQCTSAAPWCTSYHRTAASQPCVRRNKEHKIGPTPRRCWKPTAAVALLAVAPWKTPNGEPSDPASTPDAATRSHGINTIRHRLREHGLVLPVGARKLRERVVVSAGGRQSSRAGHAREWDHCGRLAAMDQRLRDVDRDLHQLAQQHRGRAAAGDWAWARSRPPPWSAPCAVFTRLPGAAILRVGVS